MTRIAAKTGHPKGTAAPKPGSRFLALLALVAFLLQSMAVQTHVHPAGPQEFGPGTAVAMALPAQGPPTNWTSPDACRLCQEIAHTGAYITPTVILPAALLAIAARQPVREDRAFLATASSFIWRSRGPPTH